MIRSKNLETFRNLVEISILPPRRLYMLLRGDFVHLRREGFAIDNLDNQRLSTFISVPILVDLSNHQRYDLLRTFLSEPELEIENLISKYNLDPIDNNWLQSTLEKAHKFSQKRSCRSKLSLMIDYIIQHSPHPIPISKIVAEARKHVQMQ